MKKELYVSFPDDRAAIDKYFDICHRTGNMVKYCNAACKKKHRSKHKKACERRVAELHDEALFKEPPPREEFSICFLPLPLDAQQKTFKECCGKVICDGCIHAMRKPFTMVSVSKTTSNFTEAARILPV